MPEEFLWEINWADASEEVPSQSTVPPAASAKEKPSAPPVSPRSCRIPAVAPVPITASRREPAFRAPQPSQQPATPSAEAPAAEKKTLIRGQRLDLATLGRGELVFDLVVNLAVSGASLCSLGLMENGRFIGDDYFVFENQPASPCASCSLVGNGKQGQLRFDLTRAPASLHRFLIAIYTDAQRGVSAHGKGSILISHGAVPVAEGVVSENDLGSGPCALIAEIYRRGNGWRIGLLLAGIAGSLEALLRAHGAEVE